MDRGRNAGVMLPRLISDGMVLQRGTWTKLRGTAAPGDKITIRPNGAPFSGSAATAFDTVADEAGKWSLTLPPMEASGPFEIEIDAGGSRVLVKNVLAGDVWLCSGQSNMTVPMSRVSDLYGAEIAACENPHIRLFTVPMAFDFKSPRDDFDSGKWVSADPANILDFTAIGYFFAKALYEKHHIPIGLINASVGGSLIEAWMSAEALEAFPDILKSVEILKDDAYIDRIMKADEEAGKAWYNHLDSCDPGLSGEGTPWYDPRFDASGWKTLHMPASWKDVGLDDFCGVVWIRKEIEVPESMTGVPARLLLGTVVDSDTVYINGVVAGSTSYRYPPRRYVLDCDMLAEGKNVIAARIITNSGQGGFTPDKPYRLEAGGQTINLEGDWQYKAGPSVPPLAAPTFFQYKPLGLYNGMIAPLPYHAIKGVIWYQGESNTSSPNGYHKLFSALIGDFRKKWSLGDFPFLYVQLPNYMKAAKQPSESDWALLREEQLKTLAVKNTSMVVAIDTGEWNDLHPLNKKDIGLRLALAARHAAYGEDGLIYTGPLYDSMEIQDGKIVLTFKSDGGQLVVKGGGELRHFAIAGPGKKFVWAKARIKGRRIEVWNNEVPNPVAIRYAWANNPEVANLYNDKGLPASPFRTDDW